MGAELSRCGCGYTSQGLRAVPRNTKRQLEKRRKIVAADDLDKTLDAQLKYHGFGEQIDSRERQPVLNPDIKQNPTLRHSKSMNDRRPPNSNKTKPHKDVTVPVGMPVAEYNKEVQTEKAQSQRRSDGHYIAKSEGQSVVDNRSIQTCGQD